MYIYIMHIKTFEAKIIHILSIKIKIMTKRFLQVCCSTG